MDKYIARENIKHFKKMLGEGPNPEQRKQLLRLLFAEETKLKAILEAAEIRLKEAKL